jgi:CheY-like chemotaxis protein
MISAHGAESLPDSSELLDGFLGKPATVSMLLDAVAEITQGKAIRPVCSPVPGRRLSGLRLLLAEDNVINQQVAGEVLKSEGAEVVVAQHGVEAVDRVCEARPQFDAVLMDVQMPEMDGFQATKSLRSRGFTQLPIIAMTANAMASDREACLAAGMNDHVAKPIDVEALVDTLRRYCRVVDADAAEPDASPAASEENLLDAKGIDLQTALRRIGDDRLLYVGMCRQFLADQADAPDRIRQELATDRPAATRRAHTMKGLAASLGATDLGKVAAELEADLRSDDGLAQAQKSLDRLSQELGKILPVLQVLTTSLATTASQVKPQTALNRAQLAAGLEELAGLLANSDLRALECFEALTGGIPPEFARERDELRGALDRLDLAGAAQVCGRLREQLAES